MKVITAPENYTVQQDDILVFLAGGITNCPNWQKEVIEYLERAKDEEAMRNVVIFNPRQPNFDVTNPNAADEQVEWEHRWLNQMDVFTMYFANGDSVQPICFYELGKYKQIMTMKHSPWLPYDAMLIGVHPDFKRKYDVFKQCSLDAPCVLGGYLVTEYESLRDYANDIITKCVAVWRSRMFHAVAAEAKRQTEGMLKFPLHRT